VNGARLLSVDAVAPTELRTVEVAALTSRDGLRRFHLHDDAAGGLPFPT
jgi:hypothetical protein